MLTSVERNNRLKDMRMKTANKNVKEAHRE